MSETSSLAIQETEKQLWEIIKSVPGLNVTYGTVRCIVYVIKKDEKESTESAIAAAKGAVQTAVFSAGVFTAPVTIPVAAGGALTGIAAKSVSDTVEIIVFFVTNPEQFQGKMNDERERMFYDRIKHVTGVGALYSAVRVPIYLLKKNRQQTIESSIGLVTNSGDTAVQIGVSMIPNIDEQLQKMIVGTARSAIRYLAKNMMDQISREHISMEKGLQTLAKVENDCQTIIEATTTETLEEHRSDGDGGKQSTNSICTIQENEEAKQKPSVFSRLCCCCCNMKRSRRDKVKPNGSQCAPTDEHKMSSNDNGNLGHLIILTE